MPESKEPLAEKNNDRYLGADLVDQKMIDLSEL